MLPGQVNNLGAVVAADAAQAQTPTPTAPASPPQPPATGTEPEPTTAIPSSVGAADGAATTPKTIEEVDEFWRKRVSAKDKAHAEAEKALREELASLKAAQAGATSSGGQQGTPGQEDPRIAQLTKELEAEKAQRLVDTRKAKYPHLAAQVGEADDIFKSADEATLAKLNALADDSDSGGTFIAPTGPKRSPSAQPKALHEKSRDELEADLKRLSPTYEEWARSRT